MWAAECAVHVHRDGAGLIDAPDRPARRGDRRALRLVRRRAWPKPAARHWPRCWPACTTHHGRVTLPGFYDAGAAADRRRAGTVRPAPVRRESLAVPTRPAAFRRAWRAKRASATLERVWARPTAEINGMWGGPHRAPGPRPSCPARAHAKVSFRAGGEPGSRPASRWALREYVATHTPAGHRGDRDLGAAPGCGPAFSPLHSPGVAGPPSGPWSARSAVEVLFNRERRQRPGG